MDDAADAALAAEILAADLLTALALEEKWRSLMEKTKNMVAEAR